MIRNIVSSHNRSESHTELKNDIHNVRIISVSIICKVTHKKLQKRKND